MITRTGLEQFDAAVTVCVNTGAADVRLSFDAAGDVLGELVALRRQVAAVAELIAAANAVAPCTFCEDDKSGAWGRLEAALAAFRGVYP